MNQLALAYGIAGLSAAIAIATVVGTFGGPDVDPAPAVQADRGEMLVADRRRERPRRAQAATPAPEVQPPADIQYVDELGNPVAPPSANRPSRRGEEDEEGEEEEEEHEEHERREHRFEREEGDDD